MIIEDLNKQIKSAMKSRDKDTISLLRLVVGMAQQDGDTSDAALEKVIRNMIKSNNQTAEALIANGRMAAEIYNENKLLNSFIPKL
jgi:uncharacterized protein YqeY